MVQSIHSRVSTELLFHQSASDVRQKGKISVLHPWPKWRLFFVFSLWYKGCTRDRPHPFLTAPRRSSKRVLKHHRLVALKFTLQHDSDWAAQTEHCSPVIHSLGQPEATGCLGKSFKASFWLLILRISRNANETQHKSKHAQVLFSLQGNPQHRPRGKHQHCAEPCA